MTEDTPRPAARGPAMILVRPQMGENIGAAARAMRNFGLEEMRLVAPRDGWPNPKAIAMASGAARVLDRARLAEDTEAAVADLHHVYATTARPREMTKTVFTPAAAMADAARRIADGQRVGVLLGPERAGLANEDVVLSQSIVTVPTNPEFSSLNLAQCALLMAYEWRRQADETPPERLESARAVPAERAQVQVFVERLEAALDEAGFFFPPDKRPSMVANLRNLFQRAALTDADVRTLHGVVRALAEGRRERGDGR